MMERLADSIIRRRSWWLAGAAATLLLSLELASRLQLRHEATDFQPRGAFRDSIPIAGGTDRIVIALESDSTIRVENASS